MNKTHFFTKENVKFHHRRDYGVSVGIGVDDDGNIYAALASVKRPGKLKLIAKRNSNGSMDTIPWDKNHGDQYIKENARNSIISRLNDVYNGMIRTNACCIGKSSSSNFDALVAIRAAIKSLDNDLFIAKDLHKGITRKEFADTAFSSIVNTLVSLDGELMSK